MNLDPDYYLKRSAERGQQNAAQRGPWNRKSATEAKPHPGGYRIYTDCACDPFESATPPPEFGWVQCPHCGKMFKVTIHHDNGTISGVNYRLKDPTFPPRR